jgi:hypothetical protein
MKRILIIVLVLLFPLSSHSFELFEGWDGVDKTLYVIDVLGIAMDTYTTERALDEPWAYERNFILGEHPSDTKLIAFGTGTAVLDYIIADNLKGNWRKAYLALTASWSIKCARGNYIRIETQVGF